MAGAPSHEGESSGKENDVKLSLRSSLYPVKWVPRLGKNRQKNDVYQMPNGVAPSQRPGLPSWLSRISSLCSQTLQTHSSPLLVGKGERGGQVSSGAST